MGNISFSHTATLANVGTSGISLVNGSAPSMTLESLALSSVDPNLIMSETNNTLLKKNLKPHKWYLDCLNCWRCFFSSTSTLRTHSHTTGVTITGTANSLTPTNSNLASGISIDVSSIRSTCSTCQPFLYD